MQLLTILAIINTSVTTILFFILLVLFILSFLFSGSQMAYFSLTLKDINMLKTRQQPSYKRIVTLLENPKSLMASLLIANTFVNIGIILISNLLLDQWITTLDLHFVINFLLKIIIISLVLILFCEVLPKVWAAHHKIWFASTASMVVDVFNSMLSGISLQLVALDSSIERAFKSGMR